MQGEHSGSPLGEGVTNWTEKPLVASVCSFSIRLYLQHSMTTQKADSVGSTWPTLASCVTTYDDHCPRKLGRATKKKLHGLHADGEDPAIVTVGRPTIMAETVRGSRGAQSGPCLPRSQIKKFTLLCPPNVQSPCTRSLRGQLPKTTPGSRPLRVGISAMCTEVFKGRDFLQP